METTNRSLAGAVSDMEGSVKGCEEMTQAVIMMLDRGLTKGMTPGDCRAVDRALHHLLDYAIEARIGWQRASQIGS
ncbi:MULTISPECIES: hypothetical protein [unclassified Chelatococcus]|uniref:hypothetical protein n=1 Tax=unclassified Chelatococcus TaxID=2638111 RepID=UPI001BCEE584|nr:MULTISPECIES: hypothetical protein [unclassified Chelatococcus]MBS7696292.1 hypothetical protein [Chelatococcus sp. YT9]MBX3556901.1 hypothetical protein [Chelatococcus sp.]